ncbi:hypothetical protein [Methanoculleus chikugoensis]|uniref:hypothetical protein n=1 Tax=Methanoculleus chikugoensis TaxID=118126 RepID=UPI001FB1CBB4|nr:hypothetical protein [Methanoculleus chikugoensis]
MVALQHPAGLLDIDALLLDRPGGEIEQEVEVVPDPPLALVVLAPARLEFLQFGKSFLRTSSGIVERSIRSR